jgi:hypothetical protein
LFADDQGLPNNSIAYDDQTPSWKLRAPIKTDDNDELKEWREKLISGILPYREPMTRNFTVYKVSRRGIRENEMGPFCQALVE